SVTGPSASRVLRVGGSGFDAANGVAFLSDGSVVVTGRFTPSPDAVAGSGVDAVPLAATTAWAMGFVACFNVDGSVRWVRSAGAPVGIGLGFPVASLAVDDFDDVFVGGNIGAGGGRFAMATSDEIGFDGAFLARF